MKVTWKDGSHESLYPVAFLVYLIELLLDGCHCTFITVNNIKQLLDEVFVISGIIKVEESVINRSRRLRLRLRLLTLTVTLIISDHDHKNRI